MVDKLQSFGSLLLSQCYRDTFLANDLKQELVWRDNGKNLTLVILIITFDKLNKYQAGKGQSLIHKTENLLYITYDNLDWTGEVSVARRFLH